MQPFLFQDNAADDFKKAVDLNPEFPVAYVQKLYTDYRRAVQKNDQEWVRNVINLFKQAKEKFLKCVETCALFAKVLSDQSKFEQADELYQEALQVILHVLEMILMLNKVDNKNEWIGEIIGWSYSPDSFGL